MLSALRLGAVATGDYLAELNMVRGLLGRAFCLAARCAWTRKGPKVCALGPKGLMNWLKTRPCCLELDGRGLTGGLGGLEALALLKLEDAGKDDSRERLNGVVVAEHAVVVALACIANLVLGILE